MTYDDDYYRVELTGEPVTITLAIGEPLASDLDLFLVDSNLNEIVTASRGTTNVEQVTTTTERGTAYVVVATALVHGANNVFKVSLLGRHADREVVIRFGLTAILAAVLGAMALGGLVSLTDRRYRVGAPKPARRRAAVSPGTAGA